LILVLVIENVHASKALDVQIFNWGISELNSTLFYVMVQQKLVIKVQMNSEKCRTKAMKIAATTDGT
jgi:hypothetical protein